MRRVLLDEGVPVGPQWLVQGFSISTVADAGWAGLTNGDPIAAAESAGFDIMVTADQNIRYQQNLDERTLALVVLTTNHWATIRQHSELIGEAMVRVSTGGYEVVRLPRRPLRRRQFVAPPD